MKRSPSESMQRISAFLFLLGSLLLIAGCNGRQNTVVLRMGHGLDVSHPVHAAMLHMAEQLHENSGGKVQLIVYPNEQLGAERDLIEQVQLGALDMVKTSTSPLEGFVPVMAIFSLPYVFHDEEHFWKCLDGEVGRQLLAAGERQFLKGLCYYDAGSRSFYSKSKPILHPDDLRGMKIRVQNSRTSMQMIQAMGGSPTPLAFGELYSALDQGVVDGAENNPPSFLTSRHYEVCKFYSLDEHTRVPDIVLISTFTWDRLTDEVRQLVQDAAAASAKFQRKLWAEKTEEALQTLADSGVQITRPNIKPFQDAVRGMYAPYQGTEIGRLLAEINRAEIEGQNTEADDQTDR